MSGADVALARDLVVIAAVCVAAAIVAVALVRRRPRRVYGVWRVSDNRMETGWMSAEGGRVVVSDDPEVLRNHFDRDGFEIREYPETITHADWLAAGDKTKR